MHAARLSFHAARCTLHTGSCTVHVACYTLHTASCILHAVPCKLQCNDSLHIARCMLRLVAYCTLYYMTRCISRLVAYCTLYVMTRCILHAAYHGSLHIARYRRHVAIPRSVSAFVSHLLPSPDLNYVETSTRFHYRSTTIMQSSDDYWMYML